MQVYASLKDINLINKDITMLRPKKRGKVESFACVLCTNVYNEFQNTGFFF